MKIAVLGAGAWGTALAIHAARRHDVVLWARDAEQAHAMQLQRSNARYLTDIAFPQSLSVVSTPLGEWLGDFDLVILGTPMKALRSQLLAISPWVGSEIPVAWLCKGFESTPQGQACLSHEVQTQVAPSVAGAALSGPSFAQELARGLPTALVAASQHEFVRERLIKALHFDSLRVYANEDIVGVEVGGAVKNVLAIATGLCDGLALGLNARAALITRGLAEMTRLGVALGARVDTFMGLSGLGDLVLTATGDLSRNRQVGLALAKGLSLQQAVDALGHVAEGVYSARTVLARAQAVDVEMPITQAVVDLLDGRLTAQQAVAVLMGREAKSE